ncbi:MAG TPA: hypothetical protein VFQ45_23285 [Longimicrobium sp.]|nr:hypothetical protein [Longimicrobium sp.]
MRRHRPSLLPIALLTLASCTPGLKPGLDTMSIADARQQPDGEQVAVEGVVTVGSGTFDAGFAIQHRGAGIYVMPGDTTERYARGSRVFVSGVLANPNQQLTVSGAAVLVMDRGRVPAPRPLRTSEVNEDTEGLLVRVAGRVQGEVADDRPYGWKLMLDDGSGAVLVFVDAQTGIDVSGIRAGQALEVTGYAGQYDDHHEVLPRTPSDLRAPGS